MRARVLGRVLDISVGKALPASARRPNVAHVTSDAHEARRDFFKCDQVFSRRVWPALRAFRSPSLLARLPFKIVHRGSAGSFDGAEDCGRAAVVRFRRGVPRVQGDGLNPPATCSPAMCPVLPVCFAIDEQAPSACGGANPLVAHQGFAVRGFSPCDGIFSHKGALARAVGLPAACLASV